MLDETIDLLSNRSVKLQLKTIAKDTGIPHGWLSMLNQGRMKEPSENRLKLLNEYLKAKVNNS